MIILRDKPTPLLSVDPSRLCALNMLWVGTIGAPLTLPAIGHLFIVCPLNDGMVSVVGRRLDAHHYCYLHPQVDTQYTIQRLFANPQVLVIGVSPGFVGEMASFLGIPAQFSELLHGLPLPKGDLMSDLLHMLGDTQDVFIADDLFMDVVGQVLQLLRLRHDAVQSLATQKQSTQADLVPRLLQSRQFIESSYLEPIKTADVASHVALSEYHFARLFKSAFDITVHQYVMRLRLDEARRLLEFSDQRVTDIAYDVGYSSLSAFINAFRKSFGVSPSAYQTQFHDEIDA